MSETATLKKPDAATRKRQDAIRRLRSAGSIRAVLEEIRANRSLTEDERMQLDLATQDENILRAQLSYRGGHAFLDAPGVEFADRAVEDGEIERRPTTSARLTIEEPITTAKRTVGARVVIREPEPVWD